MHYPNYEDFPCPVMTRHDGLKCENDKIGRALSRMGIYINLTLSFDGGGGKYIFAKLQLQLQLQVGRLLYSPFLQPPTHQPTPQKKYLNTI